MVKSQEEKTNWLQKKLGKYGNIDKKEMGKIVEKYEDEFWSQEINNENKEVINSLQTQLQVKEEKLNQILEENRELKSKLGISKVEKDDLQFDIQRKEVDIAAKNAVIDKLEQSKKELQEEINKLDEELRKLKENAGDDEDRIGELEGKINLKKLALERAEKKLETAKKEKQELEEQLSQLQQKIGADTKLTTITQSEKEEIINFLSNYIKMMKMRVADCKEIVSNEEFTPAEKKPYQEEKQEYEAKVVQIQTFINKTNK